MYVRTYNICAHHILQLQNQIKDLEEKLILSKASESAVTTRLRSVEKEVRTYVCVYEIHS